MSGEVILCNLSDANEIIKESRDEWIISVLLELGVPEEIVEMGFEAGKWDDYLYAMNDLGVVVELYSDGEVDVFKQVWVDGESESDTGWLPISDKNLVAQWKTPERIKRLEGKDVFYEIHLDEWSIKNVRL